MVNGIFSKMTKSASALVSPDRHKTNHAVILGKAIAFPSCDADAAEAFLVLISEVIWLMTPSCSKHHLKVMLLARYSKKQLPRWKLAGRWS